MVNPAGSGRYTIAVRQVEPTGLPTRFHLQKVDDYVRFGRLAFDIGRGGDPHWTSQVLSRTHYQAVTGRIPISGAGYGGRFAGVGFDSIWFDMSEIVRPTRDGIHGREYISTTVQLGRAPSFLRFHPDGRVATEMPPHIDLPLPVLFELPNIPTSGRGAHLSVLRAAQDVGTLAVVPVSQWGEDREPFRHSVVLRIEASQVERVNELASAGLPAIELSLDNDELDRETVVDLLGVLRDLAPDALVGVRAPCTLRAADALAALVAGGVELDWIHLNADHHARDRDGSGRFAGRTLHRLHRLLLEAESRDAVTVLFSGGIADAEHVPKALACGADAVTVDLALMVALGCMLWADTRYPCPVEHGDVEPTEGAAHICNLMAAWRNQLLEVLGAMGMREVRRLRGETGRVIFYAHEEAAFRELVTGRLPAGSPLRDRAGGFREGLIGDMRWTPELLRATIEQARTGHPPASSIDYRAGRSGGGFDALFLPFETDGTDLDALMERGTVDRSVDLALPLNRRSNGPQYTLRMPLYGGGMSFGSISSNVMLARAMASADTGSLVSTGEGGFPRELVPYRDHVITQVATGLFGVSEETIASVPVVEFKYAQGAKPGLGGHLLAEKVSKAVAIARGSVPGISLFSPFPFHSVYSVEDHKKHIDWIRSINPDALVITKVSTPTDVDMVAVGSYHAGSNVINLDGSYGGTGAAPEVSKKNIAMPVEYAIPKVHDFLQSEGVRDEVVLIASGGVRTAFDIAKAVALGADGAMVGTADLVALGCERLGSCEKDWGCPLGITTTDPRRAALIDPQWGRQRIVNLRRSWEAQLRAICLGLGLGSIADLRGHPELLLMAEGRELGEEVMG